MEVVLSVVGAVLCVGVGVACYFLGRRSQQVDNQRAHIEHLRRVEKAEQMAQLRIEEALRELEEKRIAFDTLPFNEKLRLLDLQ